ncbi:SDR family NAD(P)-dependent oxidoreductase [Noviherbaspirillum saxi]|uniref:SDR family NAD(P)-dependent oxidoreductase n=1 Tax=Noviherbaspirillum saxi TaxID=2320863 RepID=A0A3A3FEA5_9BURK|nr:SDR family NAD(P)-dependent oxidoreductase [Noviherbaspirillum saxi]RJF91691.1 SDR family NAD(P)-dependent oxidoreductase [Noviherbaspirillum saxi]
MTEKQTGKALVTGANRGLGKAIALELATRGFDVIAGVRDPASAVQLLEESRTLKGKIEVEALDVAALGDYRPPEDLQLLVNNAGYRGPYLPIEEAALDEWRKTFETNFFGVIDLTRRAIPALRNAGAGIICNIGSLGAYTPLPFYSIYRASKAAIAALSEGLRIELAPFGIRVIEIPIGGVDTDMLRSSIAHRPPDAIAYELYRPMAQAQAAMSESARVNALAPEIAARNVVDEIFRVGPLRRACDPNAVKGLEYIDSTTEEERMQAMLERFGVKAG